MCVLEVLAPMEFRESFSAGKMPAARYGTWMMRKKHCPSGGGATVWAVEDSDAVMSPDMSAQSEVSPGFIWTR